jgi:hypothetical protein
MAKKTRVKSDAHIAAGRRLVELFPIAARKRDALGRVLPIPKGTTVTGDKTAEVAVDTATADAAAAAAAGKAAPDLRTARRLWLRRRE